MDAADRIKQLSDTKQLLLRKLLENKNIGGEMLLRLEGSNLKILREGSPILFVFPATDGSVSYMRSYLPYVPEGWGVYGCQTPGLDGEQAPLRTIEEIVAHNLRMIRRVQPNGPYYLAGNCMGGLPAYEAARQLQDSGEETALILHLMPNFNRPWKKLPGESSLQMRGFMDYTFIIERILKVQLNLPFDRLATLDEVAQQAAVVEHIKLGGWLAGVDLLAFQERMKTYQASLEAMLTYQPRGGLRGRMVVLAVGEQERNEVELPLDSPYAAPLRVLPPEQTDVIHVDADGGALFDGSEPHISKIGDQLLRILEAVPNSGVRPALLTG
ncbi:thioesterase domain-containing protein [Chondromyces crocatus]|uniref:Thioester reductase n=1 Tax=Chondromyces crocatus TaxID=52 RepID=A0A0K1EKH4_CHOCO|nr:thioesterase domain-containing protein [Chondromyces crocatus]AKT41369.1 thioester reductase [Chondromyces crocatus]